VSVADTAGGRRRGRPGYDLATLLPVAVDLFNERGYDGTSMEDLSGRLGITKSAIYHHVPSKEELLRLATSRALDGLFEVAAEVADSPGPAIDRLERLVRGSVAVSARGRYAVSSTSGAPSAVRRRTIRTTSVSGARPRRSRKTLQPHQIAK